MKVKMLARHTHPSGRKLEVGLPYNLPLELAFELVNHGLATFVVEKKEDDVLVPAPGFVPTMKTSRSKIGRFQPKAKK